MRSSQQQPQHEQEMLSDRRQHNESTVLPPNLKIIQSLNKLPHNPQTRTIRRQVHAQLAKRMGNAAFTRNVVQRAEGYDGSMDMGSMAEYATKAYGYAQQAQIAAIEFNNLTGQYVQTVASQLETPTPIQSDRTNAASSRAIQKGYGIQNVSSLGMQSCTHAINKLNYYEQHAEDSESSDGDIDIQRSWWPWSEDEKPQQIEGTFTEAAEPKAETGEIVTGHKLPEPTEDDSDVANYERDDGAEPVHYDHHEKSDQQPATTIDTSTGETVSGQVTAPAVALVYAQKAHALSNNALNSAGFLVEITSVFLNHVLACNDTASEFNRNNARSSGASSQQEFQALATKIQNSQSALTMAQTYINQSSAGAKDS